MVINKRVPEVRGETLRKAREAKGLSIAELATKACFSVKQIEQLENGQKSHFYSLSIKASAAKKVAEILELKQEDIFDFGPDLVQEAESAAEDASEIETPALVETVQELKNSDRQEPEKKVEQIERFVETAPEPVKKSYAPLLIGVVSLALIGVLFSFNPPNSVNKVADSVKLPSETIANASEQKKEEPASQPSASPSSAPPSTTIPVTAAVNPPVALEGCPTEDPNPTRYRASVASKPGNMLYVQTRVKQTVCFKDALGKAEKKVLDEGGSYSFYGKAPFILMTANLGQTEIFFQGYKVRVDNPSAKSIVLEEVAY